MKKAATDVSAEQSITMSTFHAIVCAPANLRRLLKDIFRC